MIHFYLEKPNIYNENFRLHYLDGNKNWRVTCETIGQLYKLIKLKNETV